MSRAPALFAVAIFSAAACGAERVPVAAPPPAAEPAPLARQPADAAAPEAAAPAPSQRIRFEPVSAAVSRDPSPHVEILFPFAEQTLRADRAASYKIRLKVANWSVGQEGRGIDLVLDDFRPRRVSTLDAPLTLGDLVPELSELTPGQHTLVALAVRENGAIVRPPEPTSLAPFALVHFWVGERQAARSSPSAPRLVYVRPRGTVNGAAAAERILLDFLAIGVELGKGKTTIVARVSGPGASGSTILDAWQPTYLVDVPSGDFEVSLELVGPDGRPHEGPHARVSRVITVNRDAPVPPDGGS